MTSLPTTALRLDGCVNFRDVGGMPTTDGAMVAPGRLFRSDSLHRLARRDVDALQQLGMVTIVDLRSRDEVDASGRAPESIGAAWVHAPLFDVVPDLAALEGLVDDAAVAGHYLGLLEDGAGAMRDVLTLLVDPASYPAVVHCTAGRDRTGVVAALVLSALGVADERVVADYVESRPGMSGSWPGCAASAPTSTRPPSRASSP